MPCIDTALCEAAHLDLQLPQEAHGRREVALVHGVPRTGKTHVATLALRALLANGAKRGGGKEESSSILLVCAKLESAPGMLRGGRARA